MEMLLQRLKAGLFHLPSTNVHFLAKRYCYQSLPSHFNITQIICWKNKTGQYPGEKLRQTPAGWKKTHNILHEN